MPSTATDGRIDAGDIIQGEDDFDAISGDNARIVHDVAGRRTGDTPDDTGLWKANTFNDAVDRVIALMDVATTSDDAPLRTARAATTSCSAATRTMSSTARAATTASRAGTKTCSRATRMGRATRPTRPAYGVDWPTFEGDVIHGDAGVDDAGGGTGRIYRMVGGVETRDPPSGVDGRRTRATSIFGDGDGRARRRQHRDRACARDGQWILDDLHSPDVLDVVRRIMRQRDVATTTDLVPLERHLRRRRITATTASTWPTARAAATRSRATPRTTTLEGNAADDTITGNEGRTT